MRTKGIASEMKYPWIILFFKKKCILCVYSEITIWIMQSNKKNEWIREQKAHKLNFLILNHINIIKNLNSFFFTFSRITTFYYMSWNSNEQSTHIYSQAIFFSTLKWNLYRGVTSILLSLKIYLGRDMKYIYIFHFL